MLTRRSFKSVDVHPYPRFALLLALGCAMVHAAGCESSPLVDDTFTAAEWLVIEKLSPLPEVPADFSNAWADDPNAALLGQALYFESRHAGPLVATNSTEEGALGPPGAAGAVSCASCHQPYYWFHDERSRPNATTLGVDWTTRNTPSIVNAVFYDWYSWSGAADNLWREGIGATLKRAFQGSSRLAVAHLMADEYRVPYEAVFGPIPPETDPADDMNDIPSAGNPGEPEYDDLAEQTRFAIDRMVASYGKAIAAYVRLLVSRNAPFDRYVAGDRDAIPYSAKRGLRLFIGKAGCVECHEGPLFSDNEFHNIGLPQRGEHVDPDDDGRYTAAVDLLGDDTFASWGPHSDASMIERLDELAVSDEMRGQFRTKSLRQVATSAPFMHTGAFETLDDVVNHYDGGGGTDYIGEIDERLGPLNLSERDKADLVSFLQTLTGEPVADALKTPPDLSDVR